MSENQAVRKSNNQGLKEATFIQMGRRGGDVERGREAQKGTMPQRQCGEAAELAVPHSHVVDKNWEGYFRCTGLLAQTRLPSSPGFQHLKDKSPEHLDVKKVGAGVWKKLPDYQETHLKGPA